MRQSGRKKTGEQKNAPLRGSAVVEASVIMPLLLIVTAMLITLTFFLYDVCCAWQCSYLAVLRADTETGDVTEKERLADYYAGRLFSGELMAASGVQITHAREGETLTVRASGNVTGRSSVEPGTEPWSFAAAGKAELLRPVRFLRRLQLAGKLLGNESGEERGEIQAHGV